ncbi:MAG: hypothetical protein O3C63_02645 [Cyanobacteria bacterium]|nr:hypothetical protein [Cyanobacteriota bacterium]
MALGAASNPSSRQRDLSLNSVVAQRFGVADNKQTIQELADQTVANNFTSPLSRNSQIDPNQSFLAKFMEESFERARKQMQSQTWFAIAQPAVELGKELIAGIGSLAKGGSNKDKETKETDEDKKKEEAEKLLAKNDAKEAKKNEEAKRATG